MTKRIPNSPIRSQRGFTLIEILVAVIVLSVGLLGVASLQLASKRGNYEAMQRASATMYAEDLLERMRTNSFALESYIDDDDLTTLTVTTLTGSPTGTPTCSSNCGDAALAAYDMEQWWDILAGLSEDGAGGLLSPTACLYNYNPAPGISEHIIAIAWRGLDEGHDEPLPSTPSAIQTARACGRGGYDLDTGTNMSYRRVIALHAYIDPIAG